MMRIQVSMAIAAALVAYAPSSALALTSADNHQVNHPIWLNEQYCPVSLNDAAYYLDRFEPIEGGYQIHIYYADTATQRLQANVRKLQLCTPQYFGNYQSFYRDGALLEEGFYNEQSQREGWVKVYDNEGRIRREIPYQDNQVHGVYSTYLDGSLARKEEVEHGRRHGLNQRFFPSGQLAQESTFKHGSRHGEFKAWSEAGNLVQHSFLYEGQRHGTYLRYFNEDEYAGETSLSAEYDKGAPVGTHRTYHKPGVLQQKRVYDDQNQITHEQRFSEDGVLIFDLYPYDTPYGAGFEERTYNEQGDLVRLTQRSNEENWNLRKRFDADGTLVERLERLNNRGHNEFVRSSWQGQMQYGSYLDGERHGEFYAVNDDGERVEEGYYEQGAKVGRWREVTSRHEVIAHYNSQGELHGVRKVILPDGALELREHYRNGTLHGEYLHYDGDIKVAHGEYVDGTRQGPWVYSAFNSRNRVQHVHFRDGRMVGDMTTFNEHGHVIYFNQLNDEGQQHGRQLQFHNNGALEMLQEFVDGLEHGVRVYYHQGQPSHAERYEDGYYVEDLGNIEEWSSNDDTNYLKRGL